MHSWREGTYKVNYFYKTFTKYARSILFWIQIMVLTLFGKEKTALNLSGVNEQPNFMFVWSFVNGNTDFLCLHILQSDFLCFISSFLSTDDVYKRIR